MSGPSSSHDDREITRSELAKHSSKTDAWLAIQGLVYEVTDFVDLHPGGIGQIMRGTGRDCTELFMNMHPSVNFKKILKKHYLGVLVQDPEDRDLRESSDTRRNNSRKSINMPKTSLISRRLTDDRL